MNEKEVEKLAEQARRRIAKQDEDDYGDAMIEAYLQAGGCEAGWKAMERVKRRMERRQDFIKSPLHLAAKCKDKNFEKMLNMVEDEMVEAWYRYGGRSDLAWQAMERAKHHALQRLGLEKPRRR